MPCSATERATLLGVALKSIQSGLQTGTALKTDTDNYPHVLKETRATFVTLKHDDRLRGCIGSLEPCTRLVNSVAENAYAAAFRDPRFPVLTHPELHDLTIAISVLGPLQAVHCDSETDLLMELQARKHGWVIQEKGSRGTFLPSVWEALPDSQQFLEHLKMKAGLAADYWSDSIEIWQYSTESFSANAEEADKYAVPGVISG
ncbi:MAG: AmmeMemoRadiSam system protein A [Gammaproteobacteria bacterium]|nr:AmmeMemoRadiSam system protein A [Gammaproteobacteria bacterium]